MKLRQKIKEYLFYRHVFYCPDCRHTLRLNNKLLQQCHPWDGPYCPDCRHTLRLNNKLLQQCHPWDGPYCPKCGEKIQKSDSAGKHRVTKENTSKEMLTHEKRTFHSRSIFD
ncbi:hypothetical protein IGK23_002280 [Enterococcus sp. DIV1368c]